MPPLIFEEKKACTIKERCNFKKCSSGVYTVHRMRLIYCSVWPLHLNEAKCLVRDSQSCAGSKECVMCKCVHAVCIVALKYTKL